MSELYVPYFIGVTKEPRVLEDYRPATPSEIAAAHPKCADWCGYWDRFSHVQPDHPEGYCGRYQDITREDHYCPHHTALTNPTGGDDGTI